MPGVLKKNARVGAATSVVAAVAMTAATYWYVVLQTERILYDGDDIQLCLFLLMFTGRALSPLRSRSTPLRASRTERKLENEGNGTNALKINREKGEGTRTEREKGRCVSRAWAICLLAGSVTSSSHDPD